MLSFPSERVNFKITVPRVGMSLQQNHRLDGDSWPAWATRSGIVMGRVLEPLHWNYCTEHWIQWYKPKSKFLSPLHIFQFSFSYMPTCCSSQSSPGPLSAWPRLQVDLHHPVFYAGYIHLVLEHIHNWVRDLPVDGQWLCSSNFISGEMSSGALRELLHVTQRWKLFGNNFLWLFFVFFLNANVVYLNIFMAYLLQSTEILLVCAHWH